MIDIWCYINKKLSYRSRKRNKFKVYGDTHTWRERGGIASRVEKVGFFYDPENPSSLCIVEIWIIYRVNPSSNLLGSVLQIWEQYHLFLFCRFWVKERFFIEKSIDAFLIRYRYFEFWILKVRLSRKLLLLFIFGCCGITNNYYFLYYGMEWNFKMTFCLNVLVWKAEKKETLYGLGSLRVIFRGYLRRFELEWLGVPGGVTMSSLSRELVFLILQFLDEEKFKETVHK